MSDALDVDLRDDQMVDEIRLVTELMVIASMTPGELDQDVIDQALGVESSPASLPSQRDGREAGPEHSSGTTD
jgi:hypothetical protein